MVKEIKSLEEFVSLLNSYPNNLIVFDFYANWCGPCVRIAPELEKLQNDYPNVLFVKVNVDYAGNDDICQKLQVSSMPTFYFFKYGKPVDKVIGAVLSAIVEKVEAHK